MNRYTRRLLVTLDRLPGVGRRVHAFCTDFLNVHENLDYNHNINGERWLLGALAARGRLGTAFDVGANRGEWTALVLEANPAAAVHCFEACPPTSQKLAARWAGDPRVTLNPVGLSDRSGRIEFCYVPANDELSSMFRDMYGDAAEMIGCSVVRGADYCGERGLRAIDLLKIDVEGAEHLVLDGFGDLLTPAAVPVVQFEYGKINIATKFLLRDFYRLLEPRGYQVGKLLPGSVRFRPYRFEDEDFRGPNYVAAAPEFVPVLSPGWA